MRQNDMQFYKLKNNKYMDFEKQKLQNTTDELDEKINNQVNEYIELGFSDNRKLYRDAMNFWMQINTGFIKSMDPEKLKDYINNIKPIPHYEQGYIEKGIKNIESMDNEDKESIEYHEKHYKKELEGIMKSSDKEQVKKYDELVDKFNSDLDRIKKEMDLDSLEHYFNKIIEILDEKKD